MRNIRRRVMGMFLSGMCVAVGLAVPAHGAQRYVDEIFSDVTKTADIVYGTATNSRGEVETLTLDLYEPTGDTASSRPVYVWAHGGSFVSGNKASVGPVLDLVRHGWVAVSINYRLRPEMAPGFTGILTSPDPLAATETRLAAARDGQHDGQAAVRWARANAATYRLDPRRIAIGGFSAGAEVALLVGFNADDPGSSGNPGHSSAVSAAVSHAGVAAPVLAAMVDASDPPIAMMHGTNDTTVPYASAFLPCAATLAMANVCEFYTFVGEEHDVLGPEIDRDFLYRHVIAGDPRTTGAGVGIFGEI